jgi:uncharacterized membrane protein YphA (DoxX/SURF4 family)
MQSQPQPVYLVVILAVLSEAGAAAALIVEDHTTLGIIVAVCTVLTAIAGKIAQSNVTPLASPRNDAGEALVPVRDAGP